MNPVVVHVVRPYSSEQAFLDAEAWSIDQRSMLLIGADALAPDTAVLFDVALADGQKPIRAEGRVLSVVAPQGGRPGGLRVRFKRFGAATKAFIERAVRLKSSTDEPERPSQVELDRPSSPDPEPERLSHVEVERPSQVEVERLSLSEVRTSLVDLEAPAPSLAVGNGPRGRGPVSAPANREELLARLRQRRPTG